jgi:hypothetical protein
LNEPVQPHYYQKTFNAVIIRATKCVGWIKIRIIVQPKGKHIHLGQYEECGRI